MFPCEAVSTNKCYFAFSLWSVEGFKLIEACGPYAITQVDVLVLIESSSLDLDTNICMVCNSAINIW